MLRQFKFIVLILVTLIASSVLLPTSANAQNNKPTPKRILIQILVSSVPIHSGPGESFPTVGIVGKSGKILLSGISADGQWYMFLYAASRGWISSDPKKSEFLEGSKKDLSVVDAGVVADTPEQAAPSFSRTRLKPLSGKKDCRKNSMIPTFKSLTAIHIVAIRKLDRQDLDGAIAEYEKGFNSLLKTGDITDCQPTQALCEGIAGRPACYFEVATLTRGALAETLISALYIRAKQGSIAEAHLERASRLDRERQDVVEDLLKSNYQGATFPCTQTGSQVMLSAVSDVYIALDNTLAKELEQNSFDAALETVEAARREWLLVSDLRNCSPILVKLSALTEYMLDETLISVLYLQSDDITMFKLHAGRATRLAQHVNGLLASAKKLR
jgi:hypothetical protein